MPTTVTSSSGTVYHLWQLGELSTKNLDVGIEFSELRNDLGDGYRSQALYGSNTGLRSWNLKLPTLGGIENLPTVTGLNSETVTREAYLWNLYCETKITGTPFAYQCPRNGQYYLVEFVDKSLRYAKEFEIKFYSTGIELRQVRTSGETVFDVTQAAVTGGELWQWFEGLNYTDGAETWTGGLGGNASGTGDVDKQTAVQNGLDVVRLSGSASTGRVNVAGLSSANLQEIFIVMKMREATFSNACGVMTATSGGGSQILIGTPAGTKFVDPALPTMEYRKNGLLYANSNMQAPMGAFGIVHIRYPTGYAFSGGTQFGKDRTTAATFALMDVGEIITCSALLPMSVSREMTEYLAVKWGIS